jgi:hydrogenase expression/formation protein HypD
MVSSEGACAAYFAYGRHLERNPADASPPLEDLVPLRSVEEGVTR